VLWERKSSAGCPIRASQKAESDPMRERNCVKRILHVARFGQGLSVSENFQENADLGISLGGSTKIERPRTL
jgi:hypothetical protein